MLPYGVECRSLSCLFFTKNPTSTIPVPTFLAKALSSSLEGVLRMSQGEVVEWLPKDQTASTGVDDNGFCPVTEVSCLLITGNDFALVTIRMCAIPCVVDGCWMFAGGWVGTYDLTSAMLRSIRNERRTLRSRGVTSPQKNGNVPLFS